MISVNLKPSFSTRRANLRHRAFEIGIDQDVPLGRGDQIAPQTRGTDEVDIANDFVGRERLVENVLRIAVICLWERQQTPKGG